MYNKKSIKALLQKVEELEHSALSLEEQNKSTLDHVHPDHVASARNLLHYLAIRSQDVRTLQNGLTEMAISSHSHSESYTLSSLQKIKYLLSTLLGEEAVAPNDSAVTFEKSRHLLQHNAESLFGKEAFDGESKIMVTMPSEAATDFSMVFDLIKTGMQIARINTAHDNADKWLEMIRNIKKAAKQLEIPVRICMDIEGPKIRTGSIKQIRQDDDSEKVKTPHILLYTGSKITLTHSGLEGHGGAFPVISLVSPEIFGHVKRGEHVWFDDGKLGGVIDAADSKEIIVEITHAPEEGFKLKAEKGVNFPDSVLNICALTDEDIAHLHFIAKHADMVGFSFVQKPEDIYLLQKHLKQLGREDMGIILKIETNLAFENFPSLLFAVMRSKYCGIMVARGDLAVEIGYLRIAEVQEEILWLAEAAHMPVIWATQVLETQIKKGIATRAEISDVVKSVRAECVMLNKGPYILNAIETIKDIDKRMAAHEDKKRKILRSLHVAKAFVEASAAMVHT